MNGHELTLKWLNTEMNGNWNAWTWIKLDMNGNWNAWTWATLETNGHGHMMGRTPYIGLSTWSTQPHFCWFSQQVPICSVKSPIYKAILHGLWLTVCFWWLSHQVLHRSSGRTLRVPSDAIERSLWGSQGNWWAVLGIKTTHLVSVS